MSSQPVPVRVWPQLGGQRHDVGLGQMSDSIVRAGPMGPGADCAVFTGADRPRQSRCRCPGLLAPAMLGSALATAGHVQSTSSGMHRLVAIGPRRDVPCSLARRRASCPVLLRPYSYYIRVRRTGQALLHLLTGKHRCPFPGRFGPTRCTLPDRRACQASSAHRGW